MERKTLALVEGKVTDEGVGGFAGYASLFGVLDSQGDVVLKGAYAATIPQFLERGFIAWGHDWLDPVATIRAAREDDRGLYIEADFHSDAGSQSARTRTLERIQRGKFMGLSIGYSVPEGGAEFTDTARLLKQIDLYETSLVTVPALRDAGVTGAKAVTKGAPEGSYEALAQAVAEAYQARYGASSMVYPVGTFPGHAILCVMPTDMGQPMTYWDVPYALNADGSITLGTPQQVQEEVEFVPVETRAAQAVMAAHRLARKEGRAISAARRTRLEALAGQLRAGAADLDALLAETAPKGDADDGKAAHLARQRLYTAFLAAEADWLVA
jgi:HK97 family phage prohead protease